MDYTTAAGVCQGGGGKVFPARPVDRFSGGTLLEGGVVDCYVRLEDDGRTLRAHIKAEAPVWVSPLFHGRKNVEKLGLFWYHYLCSRKEGVGREYILS